MKFRVKPSEISGDVNIPGSKSHTIRALVIALLAKGESIIEHPLDSSDTRSCVDMIGQFGAEIKIEENRWVVQGKDGNIPIPEDVINIGNSGTSLYIGMGLASLVDGYTVFTGDHQIRNRPADALMESINDLSGEAFSTRWSGKPPLVVRGPIAGGETSIEAVTSQYLTSLLIAAPLAKNDTRIAVPLLNEQPYVTMTLNWLDKQGIEYENNGYMDFLVKGGQRYTGFKEHIPADFSSATFFLVAAALTGGELNLVGLDYNDTQGDKEVVDILSEMGAIVEPGEKSIRIKGGILKGGVFDLNAIPDALPALSVAACFAEGETKLFNVPQARLKETDRIAVMCNELKKMGADIEELPDGLIIRKSSLKGVEVDGHDDHRVVMALSIAGLAAKGETVISTAESASVTFPNFKDLMTGIGTQIETIE
ncbi:MAG: 3-phosphoshikimate 1-carboxyvinyltransferase [bacterium]|nr:3-phosphoshikimate 1-carboxyvinyltransferase [bacterium]